MEPEQSASTEERKRAYELANLRGRPTNAVVWSLLCVMTAIGIVIRFFRGDLEDTDLAFGGMFVFITILEWWSWWSWRPPEMPEWARRDS